MHLEDGLLQALLDGELAAPAATEAHAHLEACAECRSRLDSLRAEEQFLHEALPLLDHAAAPVPANAVIACARRRGRLTRWAAAIALLVFGTGVLYALPGSPLRRWIDQRIGKHSSATETGERGAAGVALAPGARFRIDFGDHPAGTVTIRLTESSTIDVRRTDGVARFSAGIDELRVETEGGGAAEFVIALPRSAPWVEVLAGGRRIFLKDGARIVAAVPADPQGDYIIRVPLP